MVYYNGRNKERAAERLEGEKDENNRIIKQGC
nr:MAG TPA: hypothetical protein [Bacteriophage sp.]